MKKSILFPLALIILVMIAQSCSKSNNGPTNVGKVMFFNGCVGTTGLYASVNNVDVNNTSISYNTMLTGGYQQITAGNTVNIAFVNSSINSNLAPGVTVGIIPSQNYTAFAGGEVGGTSTVPYVLITVDSIPTPAYNTSFIRCVNLSPYSDSTIISPSAGTTTIACNLAAQSYSSFVSIASGSYNFESNSVRSNSAAILSGQTLVAGKAYTLIYTGSRFASGAYLPAFTLIQND